MAIDLAVEEQSYERIETMSDWTPKKKDAIWNQLTKREQDIVYGLRTKTKQVAVDEIASDKILLINVGGVYRHAIGRLIKITKIKPGGERATGIYAGEIETFEVATADLFYCSQSPVQQLDISKVYECKVRGKTLKLTLSSWYTPQQTALWGRESAGKKLHGPIYAHQINNF
jgi:hypothetical protein